MVEHVIQGILRQLRAFCLVFKCLVYVPRFAVLLEDQELLREVVQPLENIVAFFLLINIWRGYHC